MYTTFGEQALVVTYCEDEPTKLIQKFRNGNTKWVVSVGMISEGTNIPRLQVCCHLTNIKTEMHYRQILGRILRMTDSVNQEAVLFMPAEPKLIDYAYRVVEDIPAEADVVTFGKMSAEFTAKVMADSEPESTNLETSASNQHHLGLDSFDSGNQPLKENPSEKSLLSTSYEKMFDIYGRFHQETLELRLTPLR
jgi:superfamily II DNA or RNA helicase